jgi:autophagy-related protein 2
MAPYFQSWAFPDFFKTSSMSKRLLQFAFSKLDIFDADSLDLGNLDVAWGKKSAVEFRDVGLRLKVIVPYSMAD